MILRSLAAIGMAAGLGGCAAGAPQAESPGGVRDVDYECDGGQTLAVRFLTAESVAILRRGDDEIRLAQQPAGSGFLYAHGPNSIRGKGEELTVVIGRRVPLHCTAVR